MAKSNQTEIADAMGVDHGPSLYLSDKNYSGIKDLKVGEEVKLSIVGKVFSLSEDQYNSEKSCHVSIRIKTINGKDASRTVQDEDDYEE